MLKLENNKKENLIVSRRIVVLLGLKSCLVLIKLIDVKNYFEILTYVFYFFNEIK